MKRITILALITGMIIIILLNACKKKDPCEEKTCINPFHVCSNGSCGCSTGYEGDSCNVLSAIKFVGNYQVTENCYSQPGINYQTNISYGNNDYEVIISNISNSGYPIEASVSGNYISIREQTFGSSRIVGEG